MYLNVPSFVGLPVESGDSTACLLVTQSVYCVRLLCVSVHVSTSVLPDEDPLEKLLVSLSVARPVLLQLLVQTVLQNKCVVSTVELPDLKVAQQQKWIVSRSHNKAANCEAYRYPR